MTQPDKPRNNFNGPIAPDVRTPTRTTAQRVFAVILIVAIVLGGIFLARLIIAAKPKAERKKRPKMQTLVQVQQVMPTDITMEIEAMGTVLAARKLALKPQISGRVQDVNPGLVPGGLIAKGETILTIDPSDYRLDYERSRNNLERAAMDLRLEEGSQAVAKREFQLIKEYTDTAIAEAPEDLALRKPQLAKAKAVKAAAQADFEQARLNLERTTLEAPFNAIVLEKEVAQGTQVNSQTTVATLAGIDTFWVRAAIPQSDLQRIDLPKPNRPGPQVQLTSLTAPDYAAPWQGKVIRLLSDVDPRGLMARLLIEVKNPYQLQEGQPPLLLGSIVKARITGKKLSQVYEVPRRAVRADNTLLLASADNSLSIRQVRISWQNQEQVFIEQGLSGGERVITSAIGAPVEGMPLQVRGSMEKKNKQREKVGQ